MCIFFYQIYLIGFFNHAFLIIFYILNILDKLG